MKEIGKKSILINASWIIAVNVIQSIVALIVNFFTARYLGPSNFGAINYAASLVSFVTPLMELGISNVMVQELVNNKDSEGEILGSAIILHLISAFVCILGLLSFVYIANSGEPETVIVCFLYSILLIFQAFHILLCWFQAKLLSKYTSIASFVAYVVVAIYKIYLLVTNKNVYWFALSNAFDYAVIAVIVFFLYRQFKGKKLRFSKTDAKRLLKRGRHFILSSMMITIFSQTDKIMLKHMLGNSEVGYYSAAVNCAAMTGFVFSAVIDSFRPVIFESRSISEEKFENGMSGLYSITTYLAFAQCIIMTILAEPIIRILYGEQFGPSVNALRIVVWYTTFSYYGAVRNIWILAEEKQKYLWIINLSGAVANIILNWFLIGSFGINGAAIASLVTQFFTNVCTGWIIKPIRKNNRLMIRGLSPYFLLENIKELKYEIIKK